MDVFSVVFTRMLFFVCLQPAVFEKFTALVTQLQETAKALHEVATQFDPVFMALDFSALSLTKSLTDAEVGCL